MRYLTKVKIKTNSYDSKSCFQKNSKKKLIIHIERKITMLISLIRIRMLLHLLLSMLTMIWTSRVILMMKKKGLIVFMTFTWGWMGMKLMQKRKKKMTYNKTKMILFKNKTKILKGGAHNVKSVRICQIMTAILRMLTEWKQKEELDQIFSTRLMERLNCLSWNRIITKKKPFRTKMVTSP